MSTELRIGQSTGVQLFCDNTRKRVTDTSLGVGWPWTTGTHSLNFPFETKSYELFLCFTATVFKHLREVMRGQGGWDMGRGPLATYTF